MAVVLAAVDIVILVVALLLLFIIAALSTYKRRFVKDSAEYFLSGRSMAWWAVGSSLFASNIGTEHFVGQSGAAASGGIAVGVYEWSAVFLLFLLGWVFAPVYLQIGLTTIPEYFEKRFNKYCRFALASMCLFAYVITKIAAILYAGGVLFDVLLGWSIWVSAPVILLLTGAYTIGGGLTAVMYTDTFQMFVFVIGGLIGCATAFNAVGGYQQVKQSLVDYDLGHFLHLWRPPNDKEYAVTGMLIGQPIASVWYWCVDQEMVQRILSAKSLNSAKAGVALASWLKFLPMLVTVFPGVIARVMFEKCSHNDGHTGWCETKLNISSEADKAYPYLIIKEFPAGVTGIMLVSMIAAMMSSLSSVFNSASTVFTVDLYRRFLRSSATERELVVCGRATTTAMVLLAFCWLPVISSQHGSLFLVTQKAMTHISPSFSVVFLLGFCWKRINGFGAICGLISGFTAGMIQLVLSLIYHNKCEATSIGTKIGSPWWLCMHFNHFSIVLAVIVSIVTIVGSLLTKPPEPWQVNNTNVWAPTAQVAYANTTGQQQSPQEEIEVTSPTTVGTTTSAEQKTEEASPKKQTMAGEKRPQSPSSPEPGTDTFVTVDLQSEAEEGDDGKMDDQPDEPGSKRWRCLTVLMGDCPTGRGPNAVMCAALVTLIILFFVWA
eukprot:TRINITY_DN67746_c6_g16_i1.p1 TRINITY_DN67746_c6_g16~~TRINITY_DN67746_c6_g16_i1.p1  ORF type:complete len:662 (-),score=64.30 TRINITY_DN67746_c6_g16_i1:76-2061(-)